MTEPANVHADTVSGFGDEWSRFDYVDHDEAETRAIFERYFAIFPWDTLPERAVGFDAGCGTGRWARLAAERVGHLHCVDASPDALAVARRNLSSRDNASFHHASVAEMPLAPGSMDFGYSLGVLHHIPDTRAGLRACVEKLKPGAPFLVYLYYALDNRPWAFRALWRASDVMRKGISQLPHPLRYATSQVLAATVYWPLARGAKVAEALGRDVSAFPLSAYRDLSFYVMRTDALDRFGTRLEQRFTRVEIDEMMRAAGLADIRFAEDGPFWTAVGTRAR